MNQYLVTFELHNGQGLTTVEQGDSKRAVHDKAVRMWTSQPVLLIDTPRGNLISFRSSDVIQVWTEELTEGDINA